MTMVRNLLPEICVARWGRAMDREIPLQIGFDAVDLLAKRHGLTWSKKLEHKALISQGHIHGCRVALCKPMAFMNLSGESVAPLARKYGIPTQQVRG